MIASGIIAKSNDNNNTKRVLINAIYLACAIINYVAKNCIGRNGMTGETTTLERPIDAMFLIHKPLPGEADRTVEQARNLEDECSLQGFKLAFTAWANAVVYHAEKELGLRCPSMSAIPGRPRRLLHLFKGEGTSCP